MYLTPIEVVPLGSTPAVPTQDRVNTCTHSVSKERAQVKIWQMTQLQSILSTVIVFIWIQHHLQGFDCVWMARSRTGKSFKSCITLPWIRWEVYPAAAFAQNTPSSFVSGSQGWTGVKSCLMCLPPCDDFCLCKGWRLPQRGDTNDKLDRVNCANSALKAVQNGEKWQQ